MKDAAGKYAVARLPLHKSIETKGIIWSREHLHVRIHQGHMNESLNY